MRILVHDFGGYAFPVQLSQALAHRGHSVCHAYCASLTTTPPGVAEAQAPFELRPLYTAQPFDKYNLVRRFQHEREYGKLIRRTCDDFLPDIVLSGNAPLPAQSQLLRLCRLKGIRFVFWLQDLVGVATVRILKSRRRILGATVGRHFESFERRLLRKSDAVVSICQDFLPLLSGMQVCKNKIHVVENWGVLPKNTQSGKKWAAAHGLENSFVFLYTGTLSFKHNPGLLLDLARAVPHGGHVVVISQGIGADWLRTQKHQLELDNLTILPYQDSSELPAIYASADVLIALLTNDAGVFSVPSKVLTYLCAGQPILAAMPSNNLAARILLDSGAGLVTPPDHPEAFVEQAVRLQSDTELRVSMAKSAKAYAEREFDIEMITDRFEDIFKQVLA